jgi:hypothetical protein
MLYKQIVQRISSLTSGGIITDENRLEEPYLISVLNSYRAFVIQDDYEKRRFTYEGMYQTHIAKKQDGYNDPCSSYFIIPSILRIGTDKFGINFIGNEHADFAFRLTTNAGAYANKQRNYITKNRPTKISAFFDAANSLIKVSDPEITSIRIDACFRNPFDANTYNPEMQDYPLSDSQIEKIFDFINRGTLRTIISVPANNVSNSQEDSTRVKKP